MDQDQAECQEETSYVSGIGWPLTIHPVMTKAWHWRVLPLPMADITNQLQHLAIYFTNIYWVCSTHRHSSKHSIHCSGQDKRSPCPLVHLELTLHWEKKAIHKQNRFLCMLGARKGDRIWLRGRGREATLARVIEVLLVEVAFGKKLDRESGPFREGLSDWLLPTQHSGSPLPASSRLAVLWMSLCEAFSVATGTHLITSNGTRFWAREWKETWNTWILVFLSTF